MPYDLDIETAVRERYAAAANEKEEALCCPVKYNPQFLREFDCKRTAKRHPRETKGLEYNLTDLTGAECCEPNENCC